jgi:IS1 family transposase
VSAQRHFVALFYTLSRDTTGFREGQVYEQVIPAARHRAISKLARQTNHIERFNNTLRQCVARLVRDALSFSKKLANRHSAPPYV